MEWTCIKCGAVLRGPEFAPPDHVCPASTPASDRGKLAVMVGAIAGVYVWWRSGHGEMAIAAAIAACAVAATKTGSKLIGWVVLIGLGWLVLKGL